MDSTLETTTTSEDGREATFRITDLPRGFGHTVGNGLRRTLLSSISGAAVTNVRIENVFSSFATVDGVPEDLREIQANLKTARFSLAPGIDDVLVDIDASKPGRVTTGSLTLPEGVSAVDPDHLLFTVDTSAKRPVRMTIRIRRGAGYADSETFRADDIEDLALDARFTPVISANFVQEDARPGVTTGETVTITVRTDGSRTPEECVREAAALCQAQFARVAGDVSAIVALLPARPAAPVAAPRGERGDDSRSISELEMPQRLENTLIRASYDTIEKLRSANPNDLLHIRNFGPRSLVELRDIMIAKGYSDDVAHWEEAIKRSA